MRSTTSSQELPQAIIDQKHQQGEPDGCHHMRPSANLDIALSTFCLTVPTVLLSAGLLAFIYISKLDNSAILAISPGEIEDHAIYVNASSTVLVFVSSWMSSLAPLLTVFAVTLATYPIAQQLLQDSSDGRRHDRLPTSFQLSIAIKFVNGSTWSSLWNLLQYSAHRRKSMSRHSAALVSVTIVTLTMVFLGLAVLLSDTWLHLATKSVNVIRISDLASNDALYSIGIQPQCTPTNNSYNALEAANLSCTVTTRLTGPAILDVETTLQALNNQSNSYSVLRSPQNADLQYLGIVSTAVNASHDYNATTFAVSTFCKPISTECDLLLNNNATFNCSSGAFFSIGDYMSIAGVGHQVYRYPDMSDYEDYLALNGVENPFYTAGASMNQLSNALSQVQRSDPELAAYGESIAAVFFCNTTVYDAEYEVVEGRVSRFETRHSNVSVTNMFASALAGTAFGSANQRIAMDIAAPKVKSAQDYANAFGDSLTTIALASGAASVQIGPILSGHVRGTLLVSQVPKAPLFLLICINLSFVVLAVVLAVLAALTSDEAKAVQFRLSIAGIVANLFEGPQARAPVGIVEQLFSEYHDADQDDVRIKIERTSVGGFIFRSVDDINKPPVTIIDSSGDNHPGWTRGGRRFPSLLPLPSEESMLEDERERHLACGQSWI